MAESLTTLVDRAQRLFNRENRREEWWERELTTSKLRNILAVVQDIYHDVLRSGDDHLSPQTIERIQQMRIRIVYECGRTPCIKVFVNASGILTMIDEIKDDKNAYLNLSRYIEALVAYHRFYGGKDK